MRGSLPLGPIILDLTSTTLSAEEKELLQHPLVGGVIFFARNYEEPLQLSSLVKEIRHIRPSLLFCVDQEGGRVQRFIKGMTPLPPLQLLGTLLDKGYAEVSVLNLSKKLGQLMALEVRSLGVDLSFAPILDLGKGISEVIGNRAFHADPMIVTKLAASYIDGMNRVGMRAVGKHFPGHGSVTADSHFALPEDPRSLDEAAPDLYPFIQLIKQGLPGIMPAHIIYPNIDPLPVGFSNFWLQKILRQQLGFKGVIVSDDLSMAAATFLGTYPERATQALEAGCDFVLICNNPQGAIAVVDNLSIKLDKDSESRRLHLLAQGESPSYAKLSQSELWQEGQQALDEIKQNFSYEIN